MSHVFISYSKEDGEVAAALYQDLAKEGVASWIDTEKLLPGMEWKSAIRRAIREARFFIILLSGHSVSGRGYVQKEIREALEVLDEFPDSEVFIIPARVEPCSVTHQRLADIQWVDLFLSYEEGLRKIIRTIRSVEERNSEEQPPSIRELAPAGELEVTENGKEFTTYSNHESRLAANLFFQRAFERSFPGVRGLKTFEDRRQISLRLQRLLEKNRVSFSDESWVEPIWYWRDGNSPIDRFKEIGDGIFLLNSYELPVRRLVAANFGAYYSYFVYLESDPLPPTGLYQYTAGELEQRRADGKRAREEYAVFRGSSLITREEYDDGAALLSGELVDTVGEAELRVRYLDSYNLVIASVGSPVNNKSFDLELEQLMNAILVGKATVEDLAERIRRLPRTDV